MKRLRIALRAFFGVCFLGAFVIEFLWSLVKVYEWTSINYSTWEAVLASLAVVVAHIAIFAGFATQASKQEKSNAE